MEINPRQEFRGVYYVESDNQDVNPIAIRPEITPQWVAWEDTGNGRSFSYEHIKIDDEPLELKSENPESPPSEVPEVIEFSSPKGHFKLRKLTKEFFDNHLKNRVAAGGSLNFNSDQDVQEYYLKTDFYGVY